MQQTALESWLEIFFNYLSGFVLAYFVYVGVVMPSAWLRESPFYVTLLFTGVSVVRSFLWRRFFNAGLHGVVRKFFGKAPV